MISIYKPTCTTHAHTVTKITKKPRGSNGSMVYSLGMNFGGTVKRTRKPKSPKRTAVKNSSRANAERRQVGGKKKNGASQVCVRAHGRMGYV